MTPFEKRELAGVTDICQTYDPKLILTSNRKHKLEKDQIRKDHEEAKVERILSDNYIHPIVIYNRNKLAHALDNKMVPYNKNKELVSLLDNREAIRMDLKSGNFTSISGNHAFYESAA